MTQLGRKPSIDLMPGAASSVARAVPLHISLLGGLRLSVDGGELRLPKLKAAALAALLALAEGHSLTRQKLCGLLWTDSPEKKAQDSLRQALMALRGALGQHGLTVLDAPDKAQLCLLPGQFTLDIAQLAEAVEAGAVPAELLARPRLAETILAGCEDLSPAIAEQLPALREAWHRRLLRALEAGWQDESLTLRQRRERAEAALSLDPANEAACRAAMALAEREGERALALQRYEALRQALREELDLEPSALTRALAERLKQAAPAPAAPLVAPALPLAEHAVPRVAVLPFRVTGPEPVPAWLAEGLVEDIAGMLASLREPVVISPDSTRRFADREIDLGAIGRELEARYAVVGGLRQAEGERRMTARLVDTASQAVLWQRSFPVPAQGGFEVQERVAAAVAHTLVPQVHAAELGRFRSLRPPSPGAYQLILEARELIFRMDEASFRQARALLDRALALDPGHAMAHAASAGWYSLAMQQGWSTAPLEDARRLEEASRQAIAYDSSHVRALAVLGHNRTILERDYAEALTLFDRALAAAPNDATSWLYSSPTYAYLGEAPEAVRRAERALELSPSDPFLFRSHHFLSIAHYTGGDYDQAAHWGLKSLQGNPHYTSNLRTTAAALHALGRREAAEDLARQSLRIQPGFRVKAAMQRHPYRDEGRRRRYGEVLLALGLPA